MSANEMSNEEMVNLFLNHNADLPEHMQPGFAVTITCQGRRSRPHPRVEVGKVRPRQWTGALDLAGEAIRSTVSGAWVVAILDEDDGEQPLSRVGRKALLRSTETGRALTQRPWQEPQDKNEPAPDVSRWRTKFRCPDCGMEVPCRVEKLIEVATRLADAAVSEITLDGLSSTLSRI